MKKYIITNQEDVLKMSNLIGNYNAIEIVDANETEIVLGKAITLPLYIINSKVTIESFCYADVEIHGKSIVHITSSGLRCRVYEDSVVFCAAGNSLKAYGDSFIYCGDKCYADLYEHAYGIVKGFSAATANGESNITANENTSVKLYDAACGYIAENACAEVFGKNEVHASDNARVITHNKEATIFHTNPSLIIKDNLYTDVADLIRKYNLSVAENTDVELYCLALKIKEQLFTIRGDKEIVVGEPVMNETLYPFADIEKQIAEFFTYNSNAVKDIAVLKCMVEKANIKPLIPSLNSEDGIFVKKFIATEIIPIDAIGKIGEKIAAASG